MKGLSMNKMLGSIKRKPTVVGHSGDATTAPSPGATSVGNGPPENPEVIAHRFVKLFCESDSANSTGDEVTYLPPIVESAESSPVAAAECARVIRKLLHRDYWSKPSYQYNAIMLVRILSDNPGPTFTRNLDKKFVDATKELLRGGRDGSVHHILTETLESFETHKGYDEGLGLILEMWKKEKAKTYKNQGPWHAPAPAPPQQMHYPQQNYFARSHSSRRTLPAPIDLANRLEEARTSAKLLEQVVACTPPAEILSNDLIKEFADRCHAASTSIQGYMSVTDPTPDNDTMESLIDTNEQLQQALNQHQRAALNARKHLGLNVGSGNSSPDPNDGSMPPPASRRTGKASSSRTNFDLPALPGPATAGSSKGKGKGKGKDTETDVYNAPGSSRSAPAANGKSRRDEEMDDDDDDGADPFRDPAPEPYRGKAAAGGGSSSASSITGRVGASSGGSGEPPRLAYEPFHPGFSAGDEKDDEGDKFHMRGGAGGGRAADDEEQYGAEDAYRANPNKDPVYRY